MREDKLCVAHTGKVVLLLVVAVSTLAFAVLGTSQPLSSPSCAGLCSGKSCYWSFCETMHLAALPSSTLASGSVVHFWCMLASESQSTLSAVSCVVCRLLFVSTFLRQCELLVSSSACCFSVFCNAVCLARVPVSTVLGGPCARPSFCPAGAAVSLHLCVYGTWCAQQLGSTAQHSTAQHSTAQQSLCPL